MKNMETFLRMSSTLKDNLQFGQNHDRLLPEDLFCLRYSGLLVRVGQVLLEVLAHAEGLHPFVAEDGLHGGIGGEVLLVLRILEVLPLQVGPEPLDALRP